MDEIASKLFDSPFKTCTISLAAASFGYLAVKSWQNILSKKQGRHYPPGPPRDFLIGAMRSFPKDFPSDRFNEWAMAYGDIVYAPVPGMRIVILNSYEIAHEFLSKRPHSTAGRFVSYLVGDLIGWQWLLSLVQPGSSHSAQRKMLRKGIGPQRVGSHDHIIDSEVGNMVAMWEGFQGTPIEAVHKYVGRLMSRATYGDRIWNEMGKELSHWNLDGVDNVSEAAFSFWMVDVFHFLRCIPDWIPVLRFKQLIREGREFSHKLRYVPYKRGLELYKSGTLDHSILNDLLEEYGDNEDARDATSMLYSAGVDTTSAGLIHLLYVLFLFPEVAQRVFEEIQGVTQGLRLPHLTDRPQLPYTEAVWKEAARWRPFLQIGIPHVNNQDEILRGYFIPKGTVIHQNIMMMMNDPKVWGDPETFRPERFLEPDASQRPNPFSALFGWGMRVCPGMYLADRVIFHAVATIISLYKVEPLEGVKLPTPRSAQYTPKLIQLPVDFKCRFIVRDERARNLLRTISLRG
ncbi:cytochrome P450 [Serendipita vermifera]|nr:cytochrome P450 [Serendipita vermifera]